MRRRPTSAHAAGMLALKWTKRAGCENSGSASCRSGTRRLPNACGYGLPVRTRPSSRRSAMPRCAPNLRHRWRLRCAASSQAGRTARVGAFAGDEQAVSLALSGMQSGADAALDPVERIFFYMPLQHCESVDVQEESVAAYRRLLREAPQELSDAFAETLRFAELHAQLIRRFGRFPHRNRVLGRDSTAAEAAYMRHSESFGQT